MFLVLGENAISTLFVAFDAFDRKAGGEHTGHPLLAEQAEQIMLIDFKYYLRQLTAFDAGAVRAQSAFRGRKGYGASGRLHNLTSHPLADAPASGWTFYSCRNGTHDVSRELNVLKP